jgi:hypothetical protein
MREIAPGLWHWTARRASIGMDVSSYYLALDDEPRDLANAVRE